MPLFLVLGVTITGVLYIHHLHAKEISPASYISDELQKPQEPLHVASGSATYIPLAHVPILMYHYVEHVKNKDDLMRQRLAVAPETLDLQLQTLQKGGYTFMFASELASAIDGKMPLPPKPVVLTFDDGYADFYQNAFPLIQKYHTKVTAYIITGFIGQQNYMSLSQLRALEKSNLVEIGAHTEHHIDLSKASAMQATAEIDGSKTTLEKLLPAKVTSFAYPSGRFNQETIQLVKEAGFTNAVSTLPGTEITSQNRLVLFRLRPASRTGNTLLSFLTAMER